MYYIYNIYIIIFSDLHDVTPMNHDSIAAYSNASHCECGKTASLVKLAVTVKLEEQQA